MNLIEKTIANIDDAVSKAGITRTLAYGICTRILNSAGDQVSVPQTSDKVAWNDDRYDLITFHRIEGVTVDRGTNYGYGDANVFKEAASVVMVAIAKFEFLKTEGKFGRHKSVHEVYEILSFAIGQAGGMVEKATFDNTEIEASEFSVGMKVRGYLLKINYTIEYIGNKICKTC